MEPVYEIDTTVTFEDYKEYTNFYYTKVNSFNKRIVICNILGLVFLAVCLILFIFIRSSDILLIGACVEIFIVLYCILMRMRINRNIQSTWESNKYIEDGMSINQKFFEDHFEQVSKIGTINFEYSKLFKSYETDNAFYLMISKNQGVIVVKNKCTEEFMGFLREKSGI